ncbi:MAG: phosphatidate cytidylyltransferase [Ruminococcaceae bacterium]|nr:phosphatidate cytidylyltransferase [Oscillospiraceae bacterium]
MKIRIITGLICAAIVIMLLVFTGLGYQGVMSIPMGAIAAIAAYEMMRVSKCKNKVLTVFSMIVAAIGPAYVDFGLQQYIPVPLSVLLIAYVIVMLIIMLKHYETTKFEHVALALFGSVAIPGSLGTFFEVRDLCVDYPELFQRSHCVFLILCAMYCAWMSDTWAYFIGSRFGKHKLSPKISPKKSVEGAIGGVVGTVLFCVATYLVCDKFYFHLETVKLWMVAAGAVIISILGMCGDLSASVIKRNFGEKDFGNLFPGHGGVLDRIDSFLVTMPSVYVFIQIGLAFANK